MGDKGLEEVLSSSVRAILKVAGYMLKWRFEEKVETFLAREEQGKDFSLDLAITKMLAVTRGSPKQTRKLLTTI